MMDPPFTSFSGLIEAWPSMADFAADLGITPEHGRLMKSRGIPAERWLVVRDAALRRGIQGVTLETLVRLRADTLQARPSRRRETAA